MVYSPYYPDGLTESDICLMDGHEGDGHCPRCGDVNYRLLGYIGAIASAAKRWGCSK